MKKILLSVGLLCGGLYLGFLAFNHIDAWVGLAITILTIGVFLNYIINKLKQFYDNEKF